MDEFKCPICSKPVLEHEDSAIVHQKGCEGIRKASEARGIEITVLPGQKVHVKCRKEHCRSTSISATCRKRENESPEERTPKLRSTEKPFDYKTHCIYCGIGDPYEGRKKEFWLTPIRTYDVQGSILDNKRDDEWGSKVKSRVNFVVDLPAADAVYHQQCSVNFRTGKQLPQKFDDDNGTKRLKLGRPEAITQTEAFMKVMDDLQNNDEEQTTINDLIEKMESYLSGTGAAAYSFKYMKQQIKHHFGNKVIITEVDGKKNVVTMWSTASTIIHDFYATPKKVTAELEKRRVIETASKLIKNDIKALIQNRESYPALDDISSPDTAVSFLPESLQIFLEGLFTSKDGKCKVASIGQSIIQSTRPRVLIAPLQLALGVQLHHHFGSRFLIELLSNLGFCSSYTEVSKFERSSASVQGTSMPNLGPNSFVQYSADNVDHNTCTLDGNNTFHGMGMIACITPGTMERAHIPRITVTAEDLSVIGKVDIKNFISNEPLKLKYQFLQDYEDVKDPTCYADTLYNISRCLKSPCPSWTGMMQMVHTEGDHPSKASILFLPMIDLNPGDMTCIFSTLRYVSLHARQHNVTPVLTFDQPLWLKAVTIQETCPTDSDIASIVIRLGGFHTMMSYLGTIGHIMAGSGLEELLERIYASNSVGHMLSGKAVSRAIRGHVLVSGALNIMLTSRAFDIPIPALHQDSGHDDDTTLSAADENHDPQVECPQLLASARNMYDDLMNENIAVETLQDSEILQAIDQKLSETKDNMINQRTARLWLQYLEMVKILLTFIKAERTGQWNLHLKMSKQMLPFLAASGHNNYTKSLYLYLQKMEHLPKSHPDVYAHFLQGLHVVRRTDRYWAGLSPDLVIEQALMRSIKTTGGLTRGRGINETQRLTWLLSSPICAQINNDMQELTGVSYTTSEQHKDMSKQRQEKDTADIAVCLGFLKSRDPFDENPCLRSIVTGVEEESANPDKALEVGENILDRMVGKTVLEHTFRKKDQVTTLSSKCSVKFKEETVNIDPRLLFQRLVTAGKFTDNLAEVFEYELCSYPSALFDNKHTLRTPTKSALADELWKCMPQNSAVPTENILYILDGGALLHRLPWQCGKTYDEICLEYCKYVTYHYGRPEIVFDGYQDGPNAKDTTHRRRTGGNVGKTVHVSGSLVFDGKKDDFLSNATNKHRFIALLRKHLEQSGCSTDQARADADLLIVRTAIAAAETRQTPVILVGDDTDLLVLLTYYTKPTTTNLYLRPEPKKGAKRPPRCWNITELKATLGHDVCQSLPLAHALLGCDTTSAIYGLGKGLAQCTDNPVFRDKAEIFMNSESTKPEVIAAGETILVSLYKGRSGTSLDQLRLQCFQRKIAVSKSFVDPQVLPPTSAATKYHSLRTYHQVQQWLGRSIEPGEYGWQIKSGQCLPILTDKEIAPAELLEMVRCNCKGDCSTRRCTCRKNDMECSSACGHCRGVCCNTSQIPELDADVPE